MSNKYKDALEDMVWQFAYRNNGKGRKPATLFTGGLSALEHAFSVLGWDEPHSAPEGECAVKGCRNWATGGTPQINGPYLSCCSLHNSEVRLGATLELKAERLEKYNKSDSAKGVYKHNTRKVLGDEH